jgi:hypothetical protein
LSASDNLTTASLPISLPVMSENEMKQQVLQLRSSKVRDEFDLSASNNWTAPSVLILLSVLSEKME